MSKIIDVLMSQEDQVVVSIEMVDGQLVVDSKLSDTEAAQFLMACGIALEEKVKDLAADE